MLGGSQRTKCFHSVTMFELPAFLQRGLGIPWPADADRSVTATWEEVPGACLPALPPRWTVAHGQQLGNQG